jgi:hypothetical protein
MLLTISILLVLVAVLGASAYEFRKENKELAARVEATELRLIAEQSDHQATKERLVSVHQAETLTAKDILEQAPRRLKLRRSLSEISELEAARHNEKERQHLDIVRNIEQIAPVAMKETN